MTAGDDINTYFHSKLDVGRKLKLSDEMILEGLSDGLLINLRQLLSINLPNTTTEWLVTAMKFLKMQNSASIRQNQSKNQPSISDTQWQPRSSGFRTFNPRLDFRNNINTPNFFPRHFRPGSNYDPRRNFQPNYGSRQNLKLYGRISHHQNELPPSPCWLCAKESILNAYH